MRILNPVQVVPIPVFIAMKIKRMRFSQASKMGSLRWMPVFLLICGVWFGAGKSFAAEPAEPNTPAASLRAKYAELGKQLRNNQFQRALYLDSVESSHDLKGEIYAVVDYPFAAVNGALNNPAHWCDVADTAR